MVVVMMEHKCVVLKLENIHRHVQRGVRRVYRAMSIQHWKKVTFCVLLVSSEDDRKGTPMRGIVVLNYKSTSNCHVRAVDKVVVGMKHMCAVLKLESLHRDV